MKSNFLDCDIFNEANKTDHFTWDFYLNKEFTKPYFIAMKKFLRQEYQTRTVYPEYKDIFNAFKLTDYNDVVVCIIGQDPYHNPNEAHGLAFSTLNSKLPASLKNIFKELENDLGIQRSNGNLSDWAKQGVFLLNTVLTVRKNEPNSHKHCGWEIFTDEIIKILNNRDGKIVFVLWGDNAIKKKKLITNPNHEVITAPHPSPLASYRGFFGSKPFSKINKILGDNGKKLIEW